MNSGVRGQSRTGNVYIATYRCCESRDTCQCYRGPGTREMSSHRAAAVMLVGVVVVVVVVAAVGDAHGIAAVVVGDVAEGND